MPWYTLVLPESQCRPDSDPTVPKHRGHAAAGEFIRPPLYLSLLIVAGFTISSVLRSDTRQRFTLSTSFFMSCLRHLRFLL